MQYLISFLEGVITFISPCLLPLLPVYISYFAGGESGRRRTVINALGFTAGFTLVFTLLGAFAAAIGGILNRYQTALNIITGIIVIFLGLNFLGVFKFGLFKGGSGDFIAKHKKKTSVWLSFLFGVVFSIGWTPCVGAFLGSALMLASQQDSAFQGVILLLCYSLGLGVPFIFSAMLIDRLKSAFSFIKRNYKAITTVSGIFLIVTGVLMMTGVLNRVLFALQ